MDCNAHKALPIGVDRFSYVISYNGYYVDKTHLISTLLYHVFPGGSILFTRPRRFGKSLALDMLRCFFDCTTKDECRPLFAGLAVAQSERCMAEQGKYPVLYLDFKSVKGSNLTDLESSWRSVLLDMLSSVNYLLRSNKLEDLDKKRLERLQDPQTVNNVIATSFSFICSLLAKHHGQPVVVLFDEYDTPLQSASDNDCYEPICTLMRNLFLSALKGNSNLRLGVITGVRRIAKDSLFSGLNNLKVDTILSSKYADCFGFTQTEVETMARYYDVPDKIAEIREWYDGYRFGSLDIYNPWSVLQYFDEGCQAKAYWLDTASNEAINQLLSCLDDNQTQQVWELYNGGSVEVSIDTSVTYPQLQKCYKGLRSVDSRVLFSLLAISGYLKPVEITESGDYRLVIPNKEIQQIYADEILSVIEQRIEMSDLVRLRRAIVNGQEQQFAALLREYLVASISHYDTIEAFYHGWVAGILLCMNGSYVPISNREAGDGRADIMLMPRPGCKGPGLIFELKRCKKNEQLLPFAEKALQQIEEKNYIAAFPPEVPEVLGYGLAFCKKKCEVMQRRWKR